MAATTFLLVEDDPNDAFFVAHYFKSAPAHIRLRTVSDGAEAMRYIDGTGEYADRQKFPLPDVILLDLKMPRVSGFEFLEWLRSRVPDSLNIIPVVVMSSSAFEQDVQRAYALGVNSYMVKPVNWEEFQQRITALGIYWTEHTETPSHRRPNR